MPHLATCSLVLRGPMKSKYVMQLKFHQLLASKVLLCLFAAFVVGSVQAQKTAAGRQPNAPASSGGSSGIETEDLGPVP
jgi:hypothetical protein